MIRNFKFFLLLILPFVEISALAVLSDSTKHMRAIRVFTPPKIDGNLNDSVWKLAPVGKDFVQFYPNNGAPAWQKSEVRFLYDNTALYIGAMLYDTAPDSILTGLSERDNINNADYMGLYFDPLGNGTNGFGFFVTASGIQLDMKVDQYNEDGSWDAVWKSEVSITDSGWIAEIKIPYTALRFPKTDVQNWKVNVWRNIMRHRQNTNLFFVNKKKDGILSQCGKLEGVENIKPPVRLSLMPYVSGYVEKNPDHKNWGSTFNGGMDLKYGINESFTLDMTMIPDFGQVQSDDKVLNLSPYETYYGEKRPFFTEGTELFNKFGIFYSKRIGGTPIRHDSIDNELKKGEKVISNPQQTPMINATKVSGRTKSGLGIGIFNAMTGNTFATVADSNGIKRNVTTQPFTNYNLLVLDQDLKNSSYINFSNSNVLREKDGYMANVTGGDLVLKNKSKSYSIQTKGGMSQKYRDTSKSDFGSAYYLKAAKISGRIQGNLSYTVFSDKLDINDMGYLDRNNYKQIELYVSHQIVKPFWKFIQWYSYVDMYNWSIYNPSVFTSNAINLHSDFTFKNQYNAGTNMSYYPNGDKDYYEPRVKGRFVIPFHKQYHIGGWISTDPRKKISFYFNPGRRWTDEKGHYEYWFNGNIAYRMNDKFSFLLESSFDTQLKQKGWVRTSSNNDTINFGIRNVRTISNTITIKYIFTKSSYLGFRMRHYNQNVIYNPQYYNLNNDGTLNASLYSGNNNKCYNAFNIDMLYSWRFAPGSELSVAWKNIIETDENIIINPYGENIKNTINSPQTNSFSIKIIYYLDYLYLKKS